MDIGIYLEALEIAKSIAHLRMIYNELLTIADEEHVDEAIKYEAKELTKEGFRGYLDFVMSTGRESKEG